MSQHVDPKTVWVVIPSYNEGAVILGAIKDVLSFGYNAVVVNDCSTDTTAQIVKGSGAHLCSHVVNLGQGAALQTGIDYALKSKAKYIVTFDGDGQHQAKEILSLLTPLVSGNFQVALGSRFLSGGGALNIPPFRKFILKMAVLFTRLTTGLSVSDTHNGFRAFTAAAISSFRIHQNRMAHGSEILSEIAAKKLSFCEVPVTIVYSEYTLRKGQKLSNSINILWESAMELIKR